MMTASNSSAVRPALRCVGVVFLTEKEAGAKANVAVAKKQKKIVNRIMVFLVSLIMFEGIMIELVVELELVHTGSENYYPSLSKPTGYSGEVGSGPTDAYKALNPKPWKASP
jgi:hypothetical protein